MGHIFLGSSQDRHTPSDIFTDFYRWRSYLIAYEFGTFTLGEGGGGGGGGGGNLPQLAQPNTYDLYYYLFHCFQLWTMGLDL